LRRREYMIFRMSIFLLSSLTCAHSVNSLELILWCWLETLKRVSFNLKFVTSKVHKLCPYIQVWIKFDTTYGLKFIQILINVFLSNLTCDHKLCQILLIQKNLCPYSVCRVKQLVNRSIHLQIQHIYVHLLNVWTHSWSLRCKVCPNVLQV
jgi:hypothetical protein